jgi:hypothetical protein
MVLRFSQRMKEKMRGFSRLPIVSTSSLSWRQPRVPHEYVLIVSRLTSPSQKERRDSQHDCSAARRPGKPY